MDDRDQAVTRFVRDHYQLGSTPRDAVEAIKDIARLYGVAVAYLDRKSFESYVEDHREEGLTEAEWERIKDFDTEYDEFVDNTPGPTGARVDTEFIQYWLDRKGIPSLDGEKWTSG
jgi:hypothetical protein